MNRRARVTPSRAPASVRRYEAELAALDVEERLIDGALSRGDGGGDATAGIKSALQAGP